MTDIQKPIKYVQIDQENIQYHDDEDDESDDDEWYTYSTQEKINFIVFSTIKIIIFTILLYLFLLSLELMSIGFNLVSPHALKYRKQVQFLLDNPFASLSIGIILTAILQNSTATTTITLSMVGAGIIPSVKKAIPIIMGANIGTCVTNSFIALTVSKQPEEFKRAFSAATINDLFNYLTTGILLVLDICFNVMFVLSEKLTHLIPDDVEKLKDSNFVAKILTPVSNLLIQLDPRQIELLNLGSNTTKIASRCCLDAYNNTECNDCNYLFISVVEKIGDGYTGIIFILLSLVILISCLFGIVKILSLFITGPIAKGVRIAINASLSKKVKVLIYVILFFISFCLTLIVQSSNIITGTLVPLCAIGMVSLQRVYVMTLGSNIGSTLTGILSAFTQPVSGLKSALQLAFVNVLFNVFGVVLWLPLSSMRLPKKLSRKLGDVIYEYKWFLYVYVLSVYFIFPFIVLGLALIPNWIGLGVVGIPVLVCFVFYLGLLCMRQWIPQWLPEKLRVIDWLPQWLSLKYWDMKIQSSQGNSLSQTDNFLPDFIRRFSAIDSVIREANNYKRRHTLVTIESEMSDNDLEDEINVTSKSDPGFYKKF